jgi:hypothetical protein
MLEVRKTQGLVTYDLMMPQPMWLWIASELRDHAAPIGMRHPRLLPTSARYQVFGGLGPEQTRFYPCPFRRREYHHLSLFVLSDLILFSLEP